MTSKYHAITPPIELLSTAFDARVRNGFGFFLAAESTSYALFSYAPAPLNDRDGNLFTRRGGDRLPVEGSTTVMMNLFVLWELGAKIRQC